MSHKFFVRSHRRLRSRLSVMRGGLFKTLVALKGKRCLGVLYCEANVLKLLRVLSSLLEVIKVEI